jgi:hypothetical protein
LGGRRLLIAIRKTLELLVHQAQSRAERVTCSALTNGLTDTQHDALDALLNQNLVICKRDPKAGALTPTDNRSKWVHRFVCRWRLRRSAREERPL